MADGAEMTPAQKAGSPTDPTLLASGGALRPQRARPEAKGAPHSGPRSQIWGSNSNSMKSDGGVHPCASTR